MYIWVSVFQKMSDYFTETSKNIDLLEPPLKSSCLIVSNLSACLYGLHSWNIHVLEPVL